MRRDDLVGAIMRVTGGKGISSSMALDISGEKAGAGSPRLIGLLRKDGTSDLDYTAELLRVEEGYDVRDGRHLSELIREQADGTPVYSMERVEREAAEGAEKQHKAEANRRAAELGLKGIRGKRTLEVVEAEITAEEKRLSDLEAASEREAIIAANAIDDVIVGMDLSEADWMAWLAIDVSGTYTKEEISRAKEYQANREYDRTEALAASYASGEAQGGSGQRNGNPQAEAEGRGAQAGTRATAEGAGQDFGLTGQTNAQTAQAYANEQKRQAEEARKNEPEKGPNVSADQVDMFNTQGGLFNSNRDTASAIESIKQSDIPVAEQIRLAAELRNGKVTPEDVQAVVGKQEPSAVNAENTPKSESAKVENVGEPEDRIYTPPKSTEEANARWGYGSEMTPQKRALMASVQRALDAGHFYNEAVNDFVANDLGVTDAEREVGARAYVDASGAKHLGVEGGSFGMEVYLARKLVKKEGRQASAVDAKAALDLRVGENVGRIMVSGKIGTGATVESLGEFDVALVFSKGRNKYRISLPYQAVESAANDAGSDYFARKRALVLEQAANSSPPLAVADAHAEVDLPNVRPVGSDAAATQSEGKAAVDVEKPAETAGDKKAAEPKAATKIGDFGEKIGGAKKDTWSGYKDKLAEAKAIDIKAEPLSKSWPEPNYQGLLDAGADPFVVAFVRASRDAIPRKPTARWKLKSWASSVELLRDTSAQLLDGELSATAAKEFLLKAAASSSSIRKIAGRIELYQLVGHRQSLDGVSLEFHHYTLYKGQENVSLWSVEKEAKATALSNWPVEIATASTKTEVLAKFKALYDKADLNPKAGRSVTFDLYAKGGKFYVGKKVGRNIMQLAGPFDTVKEARAYRTDHPDELLSRLEKTKEIPAVRRDTNNPRVGEDMRGGQDVTPDLFAETFGFKGVEFGNWVEQKKRQKDLNDAFDALMDMAAILGVPPMALSLNGELGLAFGARGSGGVDPAAAHYEPGKVVINLTKKEGAGSLGHEWWHALDNYFSRLRGKGGDFTTLALDVSLADRGSAFVANAAVRKEMVEAFGAVTRAIRMTAMNARSSKLDTKRSKEYWTGKEEMSARAFESYLISKLQDQNASNDYLANIVSQETWKASESLGFELDDSYPYPTAGEMPLIREAFERFFNTIQTKETDKGIALFSPSLGRVDADKVDVVTARNVVDGLFSGWRNAPDRRIVATRSDLPAVVLKELANQGEQTARGVFHGDTFYLVADEHASEAEVEETVFHEVWAHYGLRSMLGVRTTRELAGVFDAISASGYMGLTGKDAFRTFARRHGYETARTEAMLKKGELLDPRFTEAVKKRILVEELVARVQEKGAPATLKRKVQEIVGAIREWLRDHGFARLMTYSDADLMRLVQRARDTVVYGKPGSAGKGSLPAVFMVAWHGSPQDHDGFDSYYIGTGERARAYGWGHYFAESRAVAEWYRNKLTAGEEGTVVSIFGDRFEKTNEGWLDSNGDNADKVGSIAANIATEPDYEEAARKSMDRGDEHGDGETSVFNDEMTLSELEEAIRLVDDGDVVAELPGRLYQVELAPSEDEYLLWDKPLSEQSEKVKAALEVASQTDLASANSGEAVYRKLEKRLGSDKAASERLHSIGIRGIKYLDGSSRSAGDGDYNYVIFDDADVSIMAKFSRADRSSIDTATRRMDKFVSEFERGALKDSDTQTLGDTPTVLQYLGATNRQLQIDGATVRKALAGKHRFDISADALRQIASHLYDPLAVLDSATGSGFVVLTDVPSNSGAPVVAAIHLDKRHGGMVINDVASIHEKTDAETSLTYWVNSGLLRYVRNEKDLSGAATRHPLPASVAALMKGRMNSVATEADVVNRYGSRYSQGQQTIRTHTAQSLRSAIEAIGGKAGNAIRALIGDGKTGLIRIHTAAEIPQRILNDASYSQEEGAQSSYEVQPDTPRNGAFDAHRLPGLRRAAAGIEAPERGITFYIADDGRAIVTGPARVKVPARFQKFANDHGLTLEVRRHSELYARPNAAMPVQHREAGALYFGEMPGRITYDRTGKTRFSADRGSIRAYVDPQDGTVHVISDNIPQDWTQAQLEGLIKHEVAVHVARLGKSDAEFQDILKAADGMRRMGSRAMREAFARVPDTTAAEHVNEEAIAYFIEAHPTSSLTQRFVAWFRKMLRKVGAQFAGAERFRVFAWANALTEGDLIQMAHDALLAAGREFSGKQGSFSENDGAVVLASMFDAPLSRSGRVQVTEIDTKDITGIDHPVSNKELRTVADAVLLAIRDEIAKGGKPLVNEETGWTLSLSANDARKMGNNPHMKAESSKAAIYARELVGAAHLAETHPDTHGHGSQAVHRLYAPALIDGHLYRVRLTVLDFTDERGRRNLHAIRAVEIENALLGTLPVADHSETEPASLAQPTTGRTISVVDLLRGVKREDGSVLFSIASRVANLGTKNQIVGDSGRQYDPQQRQFFKNVGRDIDKKNLVGRTADYLKNDFWKKMAIGIADQFRGLRDLGDNGQAYMLARLSKGTAGAFESLLHHGKLSIRDGVYDADTSGGLIERLGVPLHGELDDFLWYVAANRAQNLGKVDREHLFTQEDIRAGLSLAAGDTNFDYTIQTGPRKGQVTRNRKEIYGDANRVFNEFQRNALDVAEQSGLIDGATRKFWESEFYVPFYRVSEEDGEFIGAKMGNALVRQRAFKRLKGGTDKLNSDLLSSTLLNFQHLIEASAKNRAAKASLVAAEKVGAARKATYGEKNTVWYMGEVTRKIPAGVSYMEGGVTKVSDGTAEITNIGKIEYRVTDPFVLTAITSLEYAGMRNGVMDVMSKFKHWLTVGVTASPAFKVRNLIRDSIQSIGVSELGYNPLTNIKEGYRQTKRDSQEYVSALASGGLIRFGTMLEGSESARVRQLVKSGVKDSSILNNEAKWRKFYDKYLEPAVAAYNELGNRSEEINRAALYNQLLKQGKSHAEAALMARDLMDFSMQGSFTTIRFLTQVVPFMNARLQGLYKLGRSAKDDPRKLAVVTGAVALASIALMLAFGDDDDWKRREDWDRDNFWWFKLGGIEFRIPKPFEIGAVASLAERGLELMIDDEMTGERFRRIVGAMAMNNLSMNPIPQAFKPLLDLYANKDSFTGRPIESMGMERLDPTERFNSNTTLIARGLSQATFGALSPVQIDHLVRGYFSWLGAFAIGGTDMLVRAMSDVPTRPALDYFRLATQGILRESGTGSSRYVTQLYEQAKELEQAHATYRQMLKDGRSEEAMDYAADNMDKLTRYRQVETVKRMESKMNERIRMIERSDLDRDQKKDEITTINRQKELVAKRIAAGVQYGP